MSITSHLLCLHAHCLVSPCCDSNLALGRRLPPAWLQVAWAQLEVLLQLVLLLQYLLWSQTLAHWSLSPEDAQQIEGQLLPRALGLLQGAALAYWASVTPAAEAEGSGAGGSASLDPAQMVVSLRIGDGPTTAAAAAKRPRLSQARDSRVASLLLTSFAASGKGHGEGRPTGAANAVTCDGVLSGCGPRL
jgi:hypothetical protein